jgi:hypothetical protein
MAIVTLDQVKSYLNIKVSDTAHDAELTDFIAAVPAVLERWIGPIESVQHTEVLCGPVLIVRYPPILEIVSATWSGATLDLDQLDVDNAAGLIRAASTAVSFYGGSVTVVYTSGYDTVPPAVNMAARVIVGHWWQSQRAAGGSGSVRSGDDYADVNSVPGMGFAMPRYAIELLEPFRSHTGLS